MYKSGTIDNHFGSMGPVRTGRTDMSRVYVDPRTDRVVRVDRDLHDSAGDLEQQARRLHPRYRNDAIDGIRLSEQVNDAYETWKDSDEGRAFRRYLSKDPELDRVIVEELDPGIAAQTTPTSLDSVFIHNKNYTRSHAQRIGRSVGGTEQDGWNLLLAHELLHRYGQDIGVFAKGRVYTELDNERGLTYFFRSMKEQALTEGDEEAARLYAGKEAFCLHRWGRLADAYLRQLEEAGIPVTDSEKSEIDPDAAEIAAAIIAYLADSD
ncbi:MAG: hypothetical protein ABH879_10620 [archaeon]